MTSQNLYYNYINYAYIEHNSNLNCTLQIDYLYVIYCENGTEYSTLISGFSSGFWDSEFENNRLVVEFNNSLSYYSTNGNYISYYDDVVTTLYDVY